VIAGGVLHRKSLFCRSATVRHGGVYRWFQNKDFPFTIQLAILSLVRAVDGHRRAEAR